MNRRIVFRGPRHDHGATSSARRQKGVSLIEVLVAVVVLSIAFLGMAALQAISLSTSNSSMARSQATILAYSIQDAMRIDRTNAIAGSYNTSTVAVVGNACPVPGTTLATAQLSAWCGSLANALGAQSTTKGIISCAATGICTVTVQFDDSRSGTSSAASSTQQITTTGML